MTRERYTDEQLARFREAQHLTYECAEAIARGLEPGVTEREAARRLGALLRARGAQAFFHRPFAWFGDRTGFYGFPTPTWRLAADQLIFRKRFFPSERKLEEGMAVILDVAPVFDGIVCDIGYAFSLGDNPVMAQAKADLARFRELILAEVRRGQTMEQIYRRVDALIDELGYESAHLKYPSHVLGHKVGPLPLARLPGMQLAGFDVRSILYLGQQLVHSALPRARSPLWNRSSHSKTPVEPGLWALEPHIRKDGVGAKWEELLVVTDTDAWWLDDDLPHVREWRAAA